MGSVLNLLCTCAPASSHINRYKPTLEDCHQDVGIKCLACCLASINISNPHWPGSTGSPLERCLDGSLVCVEESPQQSPGKLISLHPNIPEACDHTRWCALCSGCLVSEREPQGGLASGSPSRLCTEPSTECGMGHHPSWAPQSPACDGGLSWPELL